VEELEEALALHRQKKAKMLAEARDRKLQEKALAVHNNSRTSRPSTRAASRAGGPQNLTAAEEQLLEAEVDKRLAIEDKEIHKLKKTEVRATANLHRLEKQRADLQKQRAQEEKANEKRRTESARVLGGLATAMQREENNVSLLANMRVAAAAHAQRLRDNPLLSYDLQKLSKVLQELPDVLHAAAYERGDFCAPECHVVPYHMNWLLAHPPVEFDLRDPGYEQSLRAHLCNPALPSRGVWPEWMQTPCILQHIRDACLSAAADVSP
jgi:hypothetical protein